MGFRINFTLFGSVCLPCSTIPRRLRALRPLLVCFIRILTFSREGLTRVLLGEQVFISEHGDKQQRTLPYKNHGVMKIFCETHRRQLCWGVIYCYSHEHSPPFLSPLTSLEQPVTDSFAVYACLSAMFCLMPQSMPTVSSVSKGRYRTKCVGSIQYSNKKYLFVLQVHDKSVSLFVSLSLPFPLPLSVCLSLC